MCDRRAKNNGISQWKQTTHSTASGDFFLCLCLCLWVCVCVNGFGNNANLQVLFLNYSQFRAKQRERERNFDFFPSNALTFFSWSSARFPPCACIYPIILYSVLVSWLHHLAKLNEHINSPSFSFVPFYALTNDFISIRFIHKTDILFCYELVLRLGLFNYAMIWEKKKFFQIFKTLSV